VSSVQCAALPVATCSQTHQLQSSPASQFVPAMIEFLLAVFESIAHMRKIRFPAGLMTFLMKCRVATLLGV
jgi:hypothetical protein